jgi:DNA-binding NarL/FixJ family response regulator
MSGQLNVVLVDDHASLLDALQRRIEIEPDLHVAGVARDAAAAIEVCVATAPDVAVLDIDMPGALIFDAARTIRTRCPHTRFLFASGLSCDALMAEALNVGARGYVLKSAPAADLIAAIRTVAAGGTYFSPLIAARLVIDADGVRLAHPLHPDIAPLTTREREVLQHIARGRSQKEIATLMHLSPKTVSVHSTNLMQKLDLHDRVSLTRFAVRMGLVPP